MIERYTLNHYTLTDNETLQEYTTGVSLADCTIPFTDLLNRQDTYIKSYMGLLKSERAKGQALQEKYNELKKDYTKIELFLKEEFDIDINEILEDY